MNINKIIYKKNKYIFKFNQNQNIKYKEKIKIYEKMIKEYKLKLNGGGEFDDQIPVSKFIPQIPSIEPTEIIPVTNKDNYENFKKIFEWVK
jgi:hypothetical protein